MSEQQFGDSINKLKKVNKNASEDEIKLAEEIFNVKSQSISTNLNIISKNKSLLVATIVMMVYIILNLSSVLKLGHKFIRNDNILKTVNIFIIFTTTYLAMKFIGNSE